VIAWQIAQHGWRSGFLALADIAALGVLPALLLPRRRDPRAADTVADPAAAFASIRASRAYRVQWLAFTSMALAFAGMLAHFVPMLIDGGVSVARAGAIAGLIGV